MSTTNRFMQPRGGKDYSFAYPTLQEFVPNTEAWMSALANQQKGYDEINALGMLVPKHLEQDRPEVEDYINKTKQQIQDITDLYVNNDVSTANRKMREAAYNIKRSMLPGGEFDTFQQRLAKYTEIDKNLQNTYLDPKSDQYSPELYKYYKGNIDVQPFKTETGYGSINQPSMYQYFSPEKWTKHIDTVLDNIEADSVALKPGLIPSGVSLKSFWQSGNKEFIDKNKVLAALNGSVPAEMLKSLDIYSKATGTDAAKQVDKMFDAAATGKAYSKTKLDYQGVTDELALEEAKSKLRTKEEKDKLSLNDNYMRTQIFNSNSGMPEWDNFGLKMDSDGKVYTEKENVSWTPYGSQSNIEKVPLGNFKDWLNSESAPQSMKNIANEYAGAISKMSDKQAMSFMKEKYDQKRQVLSNTDAVVKPYDEKERDMWNSYLFGVTKGKEGATLGAMFKNDITVTTIMPGEVGTMTGLELGKKMGIINSDGSTDAKQLRRLIENGTISEQLDVPSGVMPSGNKASYVDDNGKIWNFVIGPRSLQEETLNSDAYKINQAKLNDSTPDFIFQPVNPVLREQFPAGIKVISQDVYAKDIAYKNYTDEQKKYAKGNSTPEQVGALYNAWKELESNPYKDNFVMKEVALINPLTGKTVPILDDDGNIIYNEDGSIRSWTTDDVNSLTRNTKIK